MTLTPGSQRNGYVILKNPKGYPGKYIVRVRRISGGDSVADPTPVSIQDSLEAARAAISGTDTLLCLPRGPHDDPDVIETWM